jgi:radical SAM protein with 4Fe4S-binding SPASM domain
MIIDDFKSLMNQWDCGGRILFTGGDPFLYPYFFELLNYARETIPELTMAILGNPELLTENTIQKLKEVNLYSYQVSIDGLEKTYDYIRYAGSFKITLEKIKLLKKAKIKTVVMTTVSNINLKEIPHLIDLVIENEIELYGFHRLVPIGNGSQMKNDLIPPADYKELLLRTEEKFQNAKNCITSLGRGDPLWKLLYFENGILSKRELERANLIWGGCSIGCSGIDILEDGTVLACRRLPIPIGKVPEQKIRDIFLFSAELNKMREIEKLEKCKDCELIQCCRGCRAIAYAVYGNYLKSDPQCWKI